MNVFRGLVVGAMLLSGASGFAQQGVLQEKLEFDVASVRQNKDVGKPGSNIALGPGDAWGPSGGVLSAKNFTLLQYLVFAYKLADYQGAALREKVPEWAVSDRYNIEARTANRDVTKDQMRAMMQTLLADRFALAVHYESRVVSIYALVSVKAGAMGAKLRVRCRVGGIWAGRWWTRRGWRGSGISFWTIRRTLGLRMRRSIREGRRFSRLCGSNLG